MIVINPYKNYPNPSFLWYALGVFTAMLKSLQIMDL